MKRVDEDVGETLPFFPQLRMQTANSVKMEIVLRVIESLSFPNAGFQFVHDETSDFFPLLQSRFEARTVMNTAIHPTQACFTGSLMEGSERTHWETELQFGRISEGEIIAPQVRERARRGSGDGAVTARVFGEGWSLNERLPLRVDVGIDVRFRSQ